MNWGVRLQFEHTVSIEAARALSATISAAEIDGRTALRIAPQGLGTRSVDLLGLKDWRGLLHDHP